MIALGYESPVENNQIVNANTAASGIVPVNPTGDELTDATIAGRIAEIVDIPVADKVIEHSIAVEVQGLVAAFSSAGGDSDKPQLITSADDARLLTEHTVKDGETVEAIAARYGVSVDTIKWANNLTRNTVAVGTKLKILPTSGALYKVKEGDTLASLASKYKVTEQRIVLFNDLELSGLQVGDEIVLPNADLPVNERPGYVRPVYTARYSGGYNSYNSGSVVGVVHPSKYLGSTSIYTKRNNAYNGQCTWYVIERRAILGKPLPGGPLGNGGEWTTHGVGYRVGIGYGVVRDVHSNLSRGAIMQRVGNPGHVSVVENVVRDSSGRITEILISEMNHIRSYVVNERTIPGSSLSAYRFFY
jgi:surface antigen